MDPGTKSEASTWLLAIAELDAAIARAREIAGRVEAALHRSGTEATPATDESEARTPPKNERA